MEFHEPPEQPAPRVAQGRQETAKMFGEFGQPGRRSPGLYGSDPGGSQALDDRQRRSAPG
jgi:hypothetical protein